SWMGATGLGDDPLFFAIIDQAGGRAAGVASYLRITPAAGSIEVGHIHYPPRLKRSPAATEAYAKAWLLAELGDEGGEGNFGVCGGEGWTGGGWRIPSPVPQPKGTLFSSLAQIFHRPFSHEGERLCVRLHADFLVSRLVQPNLRTGG